MKEKWERPQLVVLYRGKPEESVLCGCKLSSGGGPNCNAGNCDHQHTGKPWCHVCEYGTAS